MYKKLAEEFMSPPTKIPRLNYRAFHPRYKQMYEVKALYPQSVNSYMKGHVSLRVPEYMEDEYFYYEVFIMQSSGCLDKKNVETFEKDIIEFVNKSTGILTRHVVRNVDQLFEDGIVIEGIQVHFKEGYKVLGNIYQHKEILEEKCKWIKLGIIL